MAGRRSARAQSKPFTDRLETALPPGSIDVTTVVNMDDALWGTSGFVMGQMKANKRRYPESTFVLDDTGRGLTALGLEPGIANIVILDAGGTVLYFKQGAMSEADIDSTLELIRQHIDADT
jgi:hypothetical protein